MKTKRITQSNRLGSYLTATLGIGCLAGNSEAAIQIIDISAFDGPNGGVSLDDYRAFDFAGVTGGLEIYNNYNRTWGFDGDGGVRFAIESFDDASPRKFSSGERIGSGPIFSESVDFTAFRYKGQDAPDFGANSFVGFEADGKYGWLEVTWKSSTRTFEILSGAYEDQVGVAINAGDTIGAIPEPSSLLSTMGLLASGLLIRRRKLAA